MKYSGYEGAIIWDKYWKTHENDGIQKATHYLSVKNSFSLLKEKGLFKTKTGKPLNILDIGCGDGEICVLFSQKTPSKIFAGDISAVALNKAKNQVNSSKKIILIKLDVYSLPFRDNSFDVIVSYGYGSAASYKGAQAEVSRVLKPGGIAIIDFRNMSLYELLRPRKLIKYYKKYKKEDFKI